MKFNDLWLRELVNPNMDNVAIGEVLTMAGLELDSITPAAPEFSGVIVARIDGIEQHPDADKLRVCQVNTGSDATVQVICGAANARLGLTVAMATVGAVLPENFKIKKAKLRGVESFGMLCSAAELGLAESAAGIMELPDGLEPGTNFRSWLALDDAVYEVDLTPNRADCLSVQGVARELAVLTGSEAVFPEIPAVNPTITEQFPVRVEAADACPRYAARIVKGINNSVVTPVWMQERLRRCGLRSLSPVVDVTNYVMIELGQPMHAFDLAKLDTSIVVRQANEGEPLTLLDGKDVTLKAGTLVIADQQRPLAIAGVMGGEESAVTTDTVDILLESAFFTPESIAGKARGYGLHTDSSHRFERGVDFSGQLAALERATALLCEICGGQPGPVIEQCDASSLPKLSAIQLRRVQIGRILGISLTDEQVASILSGLGCKLSVAADGWRVVPPSYRFDLRIEVDLIEELARVYGYNNIPAQSRSWAPSIQPVNETKLPFSQINRQLTALGYQEVITYSFIDEKLAKLVNPGVKSWALKNPISAELAVMRSSLWAGLLGVIQYNQNRQQGSLRIFEQGLVFLPEDDGIRQTPRFAGAVTATAYAEQWAQAERAVDFFDIKGDVEQLLNLCHLNERVRWQPAEHAILHPGQAAAIMLGGVEIGVVGALHPELQKQLDLDQPVYLFDFDQQALISRELPKYQALSRFPALRRDLALLVEESVSYQDISSSIEALDIDILSGFQIFDVYNGDGIASGLKSVALGLILQDLSRTLEDDDVERTVKTILAKLKSDVGASLRD
jgi:phenylalanyl-tRNA synthetase beta chain